MSILNWDEDKQRTLMEEYEFVRSQGPCNMFDTTAVKHIARRLGLKVLAEVASNFGLYQELLMNFSKLMKKFNIKQIKGLENEAKR